MTTLSPAIPSNVAVTGQVIVKPAHPVNFSAAGDRDSYYGGTKNVPKALVIHTPEEDADDNEITPRWFQNPDAHASTTVYTDDDGDLFYMVSEEDCAFANGVSADERVWKGQPGVRPPWATPGISLNCQTLSNEVEGRAHNIGEHANSPEQWETLIRWCVYACQKYHIPADRDHIVGHYELKSTKTDPGNLNLDDLVAEVASRVSTQPSPPLTNMQAAVAAWRNGVVPLRTRNGFSIYELRVRRDS